MSNPADDPAGNWRGFGCFLTPAGDDPTGDDSTGDDPTGDDPTGDDPVGSCPAGDDSSDGPVGDDPSDGPVGDDPVGGSAVGLVGGLVGEGNDFEDSADSAC